MERTAVDELAPTDAGSDGEKRSVGEVLETTDVAVNHYHLAPGDRLAGLHAHGDQEEVFVVLEGTLTFETLDGEISVDAGESVRFEPGEFQSGKNGADTTATVLALGAPRDTEDLRFPVTCPECGHGEQRLATTESSGTLVCPECGAESTPRCPECDGQNLRVVLDDGDTPISRCQDCGAEWSAG